MIIELNSDYRNTVLLAGMGRSGSTWVGDIINYDNSYREIFEPFYPDRVPLAKPFYFPRYILPSDKSIELLKAAGAILSGRVRNDWTDEGNKKKLVNKRLIKDIRINLYLRWIYENFKGIPTILLLRHPCAVIPSWIKAGFGDGSKSQERILAQPELIRDFLSPFCDQFSRVTDSFERLVYLWCIYYYVPLKQFKHGEICVTFYENIYLKPEEELTRIFSFIGRKYDSKVLNLLTKPSRTTVARAEVKAANGNIINGWRKYVTSEQVERANNIMRIFGLDNLYNSDSIPNEEAVKALMG